MHKTNLRHAPLIFISVMIFIIAVIVSGGYQSFRYQRESMIQEIHKDLNTIADLKTNQIAQWRSERFDDAGAILENTIIVHNVVQLINEPESNDLKEQLLSWMAVTQKHLNYQDVLLFDPKCNLLLSTGDPKEKAGSTTRSLLFNALASGKPILSDFYKGKDNNIRLSLIVPLPDQEDKDAGPIAVVLLRIDPHQFLYPYIQHWPLPSTTAESFLVRREGSGILVLSYLTHQWNSAFNNRRPLQGSRLDSMIIRGEGGVFEGVDYRGEQVLVAAATIPGSPWSLVAKMDTREIYAPIRQWAWVTATIAGILVILVISMVGFFWRRQLTDFYKQQYEIELERHTLLQHYEYLTKYANDIIILADSRGRIVEVNERAVVTYGYSREELLRMKLRDLRTPETRAALNTLEKMVREQDGRVYETLHLKKDGAVFPVEASTRLIAVDNQHFFQTIIRDITKRKNAEKALRESQRALSTLMSNLPGMAYCCANDMDWTMEYVSLGCLDLTGYRPEELVQNRKTSMGRIIHPGDREYVYNVVQQAVEDGSHYQLEYRITTAGGQSKWVWEQGRGVYSDQGALLALEGFITDITEQKLALEELAREKERLAVTLASIGDAVISVDNSGRVNLINPVAELLTGWDKDEATGRPLMEIFNIINETSRLPVENPVDLVFKHGKIVGLANHTVLIARDGSERSIADSAAPIRDKDGTILGVILVFRDVTDDRQKEAAIEQSETRLRQITDNMLDMISQTDVNGVFEYASPSHRHVLGYSPEDLLSRTLFDFIHPKDLPTVQSAFQDTVELSTASRFEYRCRNANDSYLWLESVCNPLRNPEGLVTGVIFGTRDITERKQAEESLQYLAMHDPLTNIPNRYLLEEMLQQTVERAKRGVQSALLFIDLDNFKIVNDTYGHVVGDELLVTVARTLTNNLQAEDFVARFGGDEFAVLLEGVTREQAELIAEKLRHITDQTEMPLGAHGVEFTLTISIGMIMVDGTADTRKLLALADNALYTAKERGRNRVVLAQPDEDIAEALSKTSRTVGLIRSALKENRFMLFFQPVISFTEGRIIHYETLLRLRRENGEIILPGTFIPVAERFGLMAQMDRWVIETAFKTLRKYPGLNLFINLSGATLGDDTLLDLVESRIRSSGINPSRIGFEITETVAVKDLFQAERWIQRIKELGCKFALDDFGIGFSSFSYLRALPVDYLKIDGSFVKSIDLNANHRAIVQAMNSVSHTLGKKTIAEFVENKEIVSILKEMGVDYGQGYHLGMPAPEFD